MSHLKIAMRNASGISPGNGRPVRYLPFWGPGDLQALPPAGWCSRCGGEVYRRGAEACSRCGKKEGLE